jgi:hypothetical protein
MKEVEDIFKPTTRDVLSLFSDNGVIFQIPSYQRNYSWKAVDVQRLLKDILEASCRTVDKKDLKSLCFLGSVITVNISDRFDQVSAPLNVVDGQQRLTSLVLVLLCINEFLYENFNNLEECPPRLKEWLQDELDEITNRTRSCLYEVKKRENNLNEYMPKIIRESSDTASFKVGKYKYDSPIASLLHKYADHFLNKKEVKPFNWPLGNDEECKSLKTVFEAAQDFFSSGFEIESEQISALLSQRGNFFCLKDFNEIEVERELLDILRENKKQHQEIERLVRIYSLAKFIYTNVVLTEVRTYEEYQFDAFESLNTTGVPLTALDIFRAKALSNNGSAEANHIGEKEKSILERIDGYIQSIPLKSRGKESREIVNAFIGYLSGEKTEDHLTWQRNKLVALYDASIANGYASDLIVRLDEIFQFRTKFWDKKSILLQLDANEKRNEILTYFCYFKDLNSSLVIPILTRFVNTFSDLELFKVTKALAMFTLLWRLSHSNTSGIDSVYRKLMFGSGNHAPLSTGSISANRTLTVEEIIDFLSSELTRKKIGSREDWAIKFRGVQIYAVSTASAKLALLVAHHKAASINESSSLLTKENVKLTDNNDFLNFTAWRSEHYESLEHIAPQNIKDSKDWDPAIYNDGEVVPNSLGNLTLLPQSENSAVGNKEWKLKRIFLKCFGAEKTSDVDELIRTLSKCGVSVRNSTKDLMYKNRSLGSFITPLIKEESWTRREIEARQENLSKLIWEVASESLNIS